MEKKRYTVSNVTQNNFRFYSLTMPTDVLSECCFVSRRDENANEGFQRVLDVKRANAIAEYIDSGQGSIPSSIILSAQPEANLNITGRGRTLEFTPNRKAFLILDGQHRVYGFSKTEKVLRVPVVIYNGLSRRDETRLFIDINSKQKGVPTELLLDIKKMAELENDIEALLRNVFDMFDEDVSSVLYGKLSATKKQKGKITRVTFNAALNPVVKIFGDRELESIYKIINNYLKSVYHGVFQEDDALEEKFTNSVVFKAIMGIFIEVSARLKDRFGPVYSYAKYNEVLQPFFRNVSQSKIKSPGKSYLALTEYFQKQLKDDFVL